MSELAALGAALGGVDMAQGPGGNVSVKDGDVLAVKASGARLRDLHDEAAVARVPLADARAALAGDAEADGRLLAARLRPSLEVYFHAIGPRVVAHTHPLGALLVACAAGREAPAVAGASLRVVPYARPGRALAVAVQGALGEATGPALVLLRSHGLIAYADTADEAVSLTRRFDAACRARYGELPELEARVARYRAAGLRAVAGGFALRLPPAAAGEGVALFPDAAVFCPRVRAASLDALDAVAEAALALAPRAAVLWDGGGRALVAPSARALDFALEVLAAHDALEDALGAAADPIAPEEARAVAALPSELHRLAEAARG